MAVPVHHALDFVELAGYGSAETGGHEQVRFLKDLGTEIDGRHVLLVDEVVDTGLTMHVLTRTLALRGPASLAAVVLFDRPYRRLVEDLPVRYVGLTLPDEFYVGYGFDLRERWRNLPDLHVLEEVRPT
jgi:hypoxanthine phosphoribosyltransferase